MKQFIILLSVLTSFAVYGQRKLSLNFNDFQKWNVVLKDKNTKPDEVFMFSGNVLTIGTASNGYIRTKKLYSSYTLQLEWRWVNQPGNGGVLLHIQSPDSVWPVCYQVQQKVNAVGDLICMNGLKATQCVDAVKFTVPKKMPSSEMPAGEWNKLMIQVKKDNITVYLNGVLQNSISGLSVNKGYIGFQAEGGKPMEIRNYKLK